jgi:glycosyltransferase involved in cell wall biosynthesis
MFAGKSSLLVNLSFVIAQATGLTTYALNIYPHLRSLDPLLLSPQILDVFKTQLVSQKLAASSGFRGHLNRLIWTQFQLPKIYRQVGANLLFSPIPEAPLFSNCRFIVTVHDLIPLRFPKKNSPLTPYFRYYIPTVLNQAIHIICNSTATANDIVHFFKINPHKITPIPLAYDATHFQCLDLSTQNYFLYVGRSDPHKNLGRVLEAFAQLPTSLDCQLWIAGSTDRRYTPALMAQAKALDIAHRVKCLKYVPYEDLPRLMNQAIALVFPSLWEGFGFPVLEAMACGTPVITSNLSSLPEVAGDAALLIDPYNVHELANAMRIIATDARLRSQLRQAGLARAQHFSWTKTGQLTCELLQRYL